jgi:Xaa-Pro aminopeptidase
LLISNVIDEIAKRGYRRVGLLGPERMGHGLVEAIQNVLAGKAEISDETEFVDSLIAVKSDEEMALLKENVGIQTAAFNKLLAEIKPGMRDIDAENLVRSETYALGGTGGYCNLGSAPMGKPCVFITGTPQRRMEKGDQVTILIETKGPDGYFSEMGRTLVLGRASDELHDASALATEAIANFRREIKVGGTFPEVIEAHNAFMAEHGLPREKRVLAHCQGYDVVQRALIREDETLPIAENMFFATHPTFATRTVFGWMCDNFVIDRSGASETLHTVPQKIFEV